VTLRQNVPTDFADALGLAAGAGRQTGAVLSLRHEDAVQLVDRGLASFGSAATAAGDSPSSSPLFRKASAALDFPSIAAAGAANLTIAVPGAKVGQAVLLGPPATFPTGLTAIGFVSAAGVVTVRLQNITAAAIDPPSATWGVVVVNPPANPS
jgi:hypothetical protein